MLSTSSVLSPTQSRCSSVHSVPTTPQSTPPKHNNTAIMITKSKSPYSNQHSMPPAQRSLSSSINASLAVSAVVPRPAFSAAGLARHLALAVPSPVLSCGLTTPGSSVSDPCFSSPERIRSHSHPTGTGTPQLRATQDHEAVFTPSRSYSKRKLSQRARMLCLGSIEDSSSIDSDELDSKALSSASSPHTPGDSSSSLSCAPSPSSWMAPLELPRPDERPASWIDLGADPAKRSSNLRRYQIDMDTAESLCSLSASPRIFSTNANADTFLTISADMRGAVVITPPLLMIEESAHQQTLISSPPPKSAERKRKVRPFSSPAKQREKKTSSIFAERISPPSSSQGQSKVCDSCETTDTPYWRDKCGLNLCNACGLRYNKHSLKCRLCNYIPRKEELHLSACSKCVEGEFTSLKSNSDPSV